MKKLITTAVLLIGSVIAQNQQSPSDRLILNVPVPQGPAQVTANPTRSTGANTRFYFVVAILPSGKSAASGPAVVYQVPDNGTVIVNWTPVPNATGYDVLRWVSPVLPSSSCSCSVSLNQAGTSFTDTLTNATGNYTTSALGAIGAGVETLNVTNTQFADIRAVSSLPLVVPKLCFTDTTCQTTAGGGGGGASSQFQLTDWQTTATATTLANTSCSVTTPCVGRVNEHTYSPYTGQPYGATLTPGAANVNCGGSPCSGNIYEYLDQTGVWTFLYGNGNMASGSLVCNAGWTCSPQASISEFPNGACGLYVWTVSAGAIATTPTLDSHGVACSVPAYIPGTNITITGTNPKTISSTASGTSNSPFTPAITAITTANWTTLGTGGTRTNTTGPNGGSAIALVGTTSNNNVFGVKASIAGDISYTLIFGGHVNNANNMSAMVGFTDGTKTEGCGLAGNSTAANSGYNTLSDTALVSGIYALANGSVATQENLWSNIVYAKLTRTGTTYTCQLSFDGGISYFTMFTDTTPFLTANAVVAWVDPRGASEAPGLTLISCNTGTGGC